MFLHKPRALGHLFYQKPGTCIGSLTLFGLLYFKGINYVIGHTLRLHGDADNDLLHFVFFYLFFYLFPTLDLS